MDEIPTYIKGMLDHTKVNYDTPELESILNTTYGVLVYQEPGQCDTFRVKIAISEKRHNIN